jgi:bifunctional ADP-heptose synthase (sugar kinase/adenylyltransferase)
MMFGGKKILVVGDIALDRTFLCTRAREGEHARHAGETIFNVVRGGDDFGAIGASNNTCVFCRTMHAESQLVTLTGTDPEGDRVAEILAQDNINVRQLRIDGVQTVTRLRFFVLDPTANRYEMLYRVDKDPDIPVSYLKADAAVCDAGFLDWFEGEAQRSDIIFFNDTDKGFLSAGVVASLSQRIRRATSYRTTHGLHGPIVVVDPKNDWEKYRSLDVTIFKPNHVEAAKVLHLPDFDPGLDTHLEMLGDKLCAHFGNSFPRFVVTLGRVGAAVLDLSEPDRALYMHAAVPPVTTADGAATHCGDMFATALALSYSLDGDLAAAVDFANYVGSVQYALPTGRKVALGDIVHEDNRRHLQRCYRPRRLVAKIGQKT